MAENLVDSTFTQNTMGLWCRLFKRTQSLRNSSKKYWTFATHLDVWMPKMI